jgi:hypothetical protein
MQGFAVLQGFALVQGWSLFALFFFGSFHGLHCLSDCLCPSARLWVERLPLARPKKIAGFNLELLKATDFPKK